MAPSACTRHLVRDADEDRQHLERRLQEQRGERAPGHTSRSVSRTFVSRS